MSWFDTAGIASLAKNALKEAQKTIDKALDIKDDDTTPRSVVKGSAKRNFYISVKINRIYVFYLNFCTFVETPPVEEDSDGFFSSWSVKSPSSPPIAKRGAAPDTTAIEEEPAPSNSSSTIWGSFTGSFFETDALKSGPRGE